MTVNAIHDDHGIAGEIKNIYVVVLDITTSLVAMFKDIAMRIPTRVDRVSCQPNARSFLPKLEHATFTWVHCTIYTYSEHHPSSSERDKRIAAPHHL